MMYFKWKKNKIKNQKFYHFDLSQKRNLLLFKRKIFNQITNGNTPTCLIHLKYCLILRSCKIKKILNYMKRITDHHDGQSFKFDKHKVTPCIFPVTINLHIKNILTWFDKIILINIIFRNPKVRRYQFMILITL